MYETLRAIYFERTHRKWQRCHSHGQKIELGLLLDSKALSGRKSKVCDLFESAKDDPKKVTGREIIIREIFTLSFATPKTWEDDGVTHLRV